MINEIKIIDKGKMLKVRDYGKKLYFMANGDVIKCDKEALVKWLQLKPKTYAQILAERNARYAHLDELQHE